MTSIFTELEQTLETEGPDRALERLCVELRQRRDYHGLFYGLLLRRWVALGLPPVQLGNEDRLAPAQREAYLSAFREAARTVGQLCLDEGDVIGAWPFFRSIGERAPIAAAIERATADDSERTSQLIEIALHEGANPRKGFELLLERYGICSAITTLSQELPISSADREACVRRLVRALYNELRGRLADEIARREGTAPPPEATVGQMVQGRAWLAEEDTYLIDVSHLGSVVQFSLGLPPCPELQLAIELCEFGAKLPARFQPSADVPFENQYEDFRIYLRTLAGEEVAEGIAHFRAKAETVRPEEAGTLPGEVLVSLLHRLGRHREAVQAYARYLAQADTRRLSCPSLVELCELVGDYQPLVDVAMRRGDLLNYTAGLLQARRGT